MSSFSSDDMHSRMQDISFVVGKSMRGQIEKQLVLLELDGYTPEWMARNMTPVMFTSEIDDNNGDLVLRGGLQWMGELRELLGDEPLICAEVRLKIKGA